MIESLNPVAMRVSLNNTHTRLQTTVWSLSTLPRRRRCVHKWRAYNLSSPADGWETLQLLGTGATTIKGPSQWLRKHGSEKRGKKTVAAERINIKAARGIRQQRKGAECFLQILLQSCEERPHIAGGETPELFYACKNTPFDMFRLCNTDC